MKFKAPIEVESSLVDSSNSSGSAGQVLTSTGTGVDWIDPTLLPAESAEKVIQSVRMGEAVSKGDPLVITGYHGSSGPAIVERADATNATKMPAYGVAIEDYANNATGLMIAVGDFDDFDTSGYSVGDTLYVAVGGGMTNVKPTGTALIQNMGIVSRSNANNGQAEIVAIGRTNDVPNLPEGRLFVGTSGNTSLTSDVVYIDDTNDRVGIGTTSPIGKLYVGQTWNTSSGGNALYIKSPSVDNDSYDPQISNTADLGITMVTDSATTTGPDTVGLTLYNDDGTAGGFSPMLLFAKLETPTSQYKASMAGIYARSPLGTGNSGNWIDGELIFATAGAASQGIKQRMVINKEGNVGIGTPSPGEKLEVNGNILSTGTVTGQNFYGNQFFDAQDNAYYANPAGTSVMNGASFAGNVTAATFVGALSGNASSATTLQTARTIAGVSFDGSANISLNNNAITNGAGYTTNTGTITGVSTGTGLDGTWSSGGGTIALDLNELGASGTLIGTDDLVVVDGTATKKTQISTIPLSIFSNNAGWTSNAGDITSVTAGNKLTGGGTSGAVTLGLASNNVSQWTNDSGYTSNTGDITGVGAGTGMTGGGTSGTVTLNVIGGSGITANANDIAVDSTVVRTTGTQTITGAKTIDTLKIGSANKIQFSNNDFIRYEDATGVGRFHFDSDGGTNNSSVQAATFVGALSGNATTATLAATATTANLIKVNDYAGSTNMRILGSHQTGGSDNVYSAGSMYLNCDTGIINATGFVGALTGNATTATTATTASSVSHSYSRTDTASYPVVWMTASSTSQAYSCAAVTITSSAGRINATAVAASTLNATTVTASVVGNNSSQTRDKLRVWGSSPFSIGMMSGYGYGGLGGNSTGTEYAMSFQMSNTANRGWWWGDTSHTNLQGAMSLTTTGKAVIATSLSIGYGETIRTAATQALEVKGTVYATPVTFTSNQSEYVLKMGASNSTAFDQGIKLKSDSGGSSYISINARSEDTLVLRAGKVGIGTTSPGYKLQLSTNSAAKPSSSTWTVVSDERVKENIKPYEKGLNEILQVNTKTFDYNGKAGFDKIKDNVGIIAQDMIKIFPETIKTYNAKLNETDEEETELYNFDGHALTFALINAVQELKAEIEELKKQINK